MNFYGISIISHSWVLCDCTLSQYKKFKKVIFADLLQILFFIFKILHIIYIF